MKRPEPPRTADGQLAGACGEPWHGAHPRCQADMEAACQAFDDGVAAGRWDAAGYTPNERKAQAKRRGVA